MIRFGLAKFDALAPRVAAWTCLCVGVAVVAAETQPMPVTHWIEQRRAQQAQQNDERLAELQLAAGVYLSNKGARETAEKTGFPGAAAALEQYMAGEGKALLAKVRAGEALTEEEQKYRNVVLAVWYRVGHSAGSDIKKDRELEHEYYLADELDLSADDMRQAYADLGKAREHGIEVLRQAYLDGGMLTAEDLQAIEDLRIAYSGQSISEMYLPAQLGFHPLAPRSKPDGDFSWGHEVRRQLPGTKVPDVRRATLEAVRERDSYTEIPDFARGFRSLVRPDGVVQYLEVMSGYEMTEVDGTPVARLPDDLTGPGEEGTVSVQEIVDGKPVLFFHNDPVDLPLTRAIDMVPVVMKAYEDVFDFHFATVGIHDRNYAANRYYEFANPSGSLRVGHHHTWDEEERARRLSVMLVQWPQSDVFPASVDNMFDHTKDRFAGNGGQNRYYLVGHDGVISHENAGPFEATNEFNVAEGAMIRLLENGGTGVVEEADKLPYFAPSDPDLLITSADVTKVDSDGIELSWNGNTFRVEPTEHAHVTLNHELAELSDLQVGDKAIVFSRLSRVMPGVSFEWPDVGHERLSEPMALEQDGRTFVGRRLGHMNSMDQHVLLLNDLDGIDVLPGTQIMGLRDQKRHNRQETYANTRIIWRGGRVTAVDPQTREVTVAWHDYDTDGVNGRSILKEWDDEGIEYKLDRDTKRRHEIVETWIEAGSGESKLHVPDHCAITLNGQYQDDLVVQPDDFVTARFQLNVMDQETPPTNFLRITRLPQN